MMIFMIFMVIFNFISQIYTKNNKEDYDDDSKIINGATIIEPSVSSSQLLLLFRKYNQVHDIFISND